MRRIMPGIYPARQPAVPIATSLLVVVLSGWCSGAPVVAGQQEIAPTKDPQSLFAPSDPPASAGTGQESQISALESIRRSLSESIEPEVVGNTLRQEPEPQAAQDPQSDYWDLLSSELETSRQVEDLGDRIQKLVKIDRERKRRQREGWNNDPGTTPAESSRAAGVEAIADGINNPPVDVADENSGEITETSRSALETTRVLSEPPDHLALADSLFFSGETVLALDLYRKARHSGVLEGDETWIRYQIACCLRRTRKIDEANRIYREIAESAGTDPVGSSARWWLDTINRKQLLQGELDTFKSFIENKEAMDATDKQVPRTDP